MKKSLFAMIIATLLAILLVGCSNQNITVVGTVKELNEHGIIMETQDSRLSDVAFVSYDKKDLKQLAVGQKVTVEALPEIQETYPVKIKAVKITAIKEE